MNQMGAMTKGLAKGRLSGLPLFLTHRSETILWGVVLLLLFLHLSTALQRAVNWDEYYHYSLLETFARGEHIQPLQTLYVPVLAWTTDLPGSEIDHIIIVRLLMWACLVVTSLSITGMVTTLASRSTGLICAACYLGAGFVLHHGTSFRTDPMAAALLSAALWIFVSSSLSWRAMAVAGVIVGIAGMTTIKAILWLPAFMGVGLVRWQASQWDPLLIFRFAVATAVAAIAFTLIYFLHANALPVEPQGSTSAYFSGASRKMFGFLHSPYLSLMAKGALTALPFVALIIALPFLLLITEGKAAFKIGLLGLWLPAFIPLFYHNSAPYLYTFILAPVAVAIYLSVEHATKRYNVVAIAALLGSVGLANWFIDDRGPLNHQRQVLEVTKDLFDGPVTYFDCCASIGSWPSGNGFRTPWGVEQYLGAGRPAFRAKMQEEQVPLLIANDDMYERLFAGQTVYGFHPEDEQTLRDTYIHFWGPLYLAGVKLQPLEETEWHVMVPGEYTVEGSLVINGVSYADGQTVLIDRGKLELMAVSSEPASLIWGDSISVPDITAPTKIWTGW